MYKEKSRTKEAVKLFQKVYNIRKIIHGETDRATLRCIDKLELAYMQLGKLNKAVLVLKKVIDTRKIAFGED